MNKEMLDKVLNTYECLISCCTTLPGMKLEDAFSPEALKNIQEEHEWLKQEVELIATAPDQQDQVWALTNGWEVQKASLYDEEGVEGWTWTDPENNQYTETGLWDELPPWPDAAREAVAKAKAKGECNE